MVVNGKFALRKHRKRRRLALSARRRAGVSGQSILEFLLSLPILLGLTFIMIRVNTAIQISIVNQQYGRGQALFIAQNSAVYPRREHRDIMAQTESNQMILGVADNSLASESEDYETGSTYRPIATTQFIARVKRGLAASKGPDKEDQPKQRSYVRIRNTVSLCTPSIMIKANGSGLSRLEPGQLTEAMKPENFIYCYAGKVAMEPLQ